MVWEVDRAGRTYRKVISWSTWDLSGPSRVSQGPESQGALLEVLSACLRVLGVPFAKVAEATTVCTVNLGPAGFRGQGLALPVTPAPGEDGLLPTLGRTLEFLP